MAKHIYYIIANGEFKESTIRHYRLDPRRKTSITTQGNITLYYAEYSGVFDLEDKGIVWKKYSSKDRDKGHIGLIGIKVKRKIGFLRFWKGFINISQVR